MSQIVKTSVLDCGVKTSETTIPCVRKSQLPGFAQIGQQYYAHA